MITPPAATLKEQCDCLGDWLSLDEDVFSPLTFTFSLKIRLSVTSRQILYECTYMRSLVAKLTESRMVVALGWGEEETGSCLMCPELVWQDAKDLRIGCATMWTCYVHTYTHFQTVKMATFVMCILLQLQKPDLSCMTHYERELKVAWREQAEVTTVMCRCVNLAVTTTNPCRSLSELPPTSCAAQPPDETDTLLGPSDARTSLPLTTPTQPLHTGRHWHKTKRCHFARVWWGV